MKVLVAHNRYRSDVPSGENAVVEAELADLRAAGVDVVPMLADSDDVALRSPRGLIEAAAGPVYAPRGVPQFRTLLERERPDVVHVHNVYPLLSPWIVRAAHDHGVPVVHTVHNFRHDCVAGTYFRDGHVCTDCAGKRFAVPAVRHGCYRGSRAQTVPMAIGRAVHRATWLGVDRFLALTEFHAGYLRSLGVPGDRIVVRPTSAPDPGEPSAPGTDVLFVGRLEEQKGVRVLLDAWARRSGLRGSRLHLVGDGPLRAVADAAAAGDPSVVVHGLQGPGQVADRFRSAGVVVIPSTWFEGLPRVLVEAMAHGRPLAVSALGGLGAAVTADVGWTFTPDAGALAAVLDEISPDAVRAKGAAARETYLSTYTPDVTTRALLDVYEQLAGSRR